MNLITNRYFLIALTFALYIGATRLQKRTGLRLLNPILIAMGGMIVFLSIFHIDYEVYQAGGEYIDFWLKPAVVALGVPLYKQLSTIKKQLIPLLVAELAGCVAGIISVVALAKLFNASNEVILWHLKQLRLQ